MGRERTEDLGREHIHARARLVKLLEKPAALDLTYVAQHTGTREPPQVIVDLLPWHPEDPSEAAGPRRLPRQLDDSAAQRVHEQLCRLRLVHCADRFHAHTGILD